MDRRSFLRAAALGAAGIALGGCDDALWNILNEDEEGEWGINVHPYSGALFDVQLQALRELRLARVRITLGLTRDLAGPYLRAYPAEYTGIVGDFGGERMDVATWTARVRDTVRRSSGVRHFEILNEPMHLEPAVYVRDYLRPAYETIKAADAGAQVVAAAPTSTSDGRVYFYQMTDAGADRWCDRRAVHLYENNPELYLKGTDRPFMVTEAGARNPARHVEWWTDIMPHIAGVLETDLMHFYVLMDNPDSGFGLVSSGTGSQLTPVSPLYDHLKNR